MIGLAYTTESPAICPNSGHFAPEQPEMSSSTPLSSACCHREASYHHGDRHGGVGICPHPSLRGTSRPKEVSRQGAIFRVLWLALRADSRRGKDATCRCRSSADAHARIVSGRRAARGG